MDKYKETYKIDKKISVKLSILKAVFLFIGFIYLLDKAIF